MNLIFSNPTALWALIGLPIVVAIHFLQRRSRRQVVTTLFLLQQMRRQSETGNRFERLRLSVPLWLQLLMVLLFTWLLAGPRWLSKDAVQRIAVVMDSSASMQAFRTAAERKVQQTLSTLVTPLGNAELTLLSSNAEAASLYHGPSTGQLTSALQHWKPVVAVHDFAPALRAARSLVGATGTVILVTDHQPKQSLPFNAHTVSVGQNTANVGWVGIEVEKVDQQWVWHALVRNYGRTHQERQWRVEKDGKASSWTNLMLGPGEMQSLSGPLGVAGAEEAITLSLTPDALTLDDQLPVLLPVRKVLNLQITAGKEDQGLSDLFSRYSDCQVLPANATPEAGEGNALFVRPDCRRR